MSDFYALLEVDRTANADQIRRAYYRMARLHHPDLQGAGATAGSNDQFLRIQEAYEVLGTPLTRQRYDEKLREKQRQAPAASKPVDRHSGPKASAPKAKASPKQDSHKAPEKKVSLDDVRKARQGFMRAEEYLEAGHVGKVITLMEAVVRVMDSEPEYMSLFGYALALNKDRLHLARDFCRRASEAEPHNLEFRARLGYVYHRAGLHKTADGIFDEVLAVDEKHPIASAHHSNAKGAGGGLLGLVNKLFSR